MTLPGDLTATVVTGKFLDPAGDALTGRVTFTPSAEVTDATGMVVIPAVTRSYPLSAQGAFTSDPLASTDNADLAPESWEYVVTVSLAKAPEFSFSVAIPHSPSPVDLSALIAA